MNNDELSLFLNQSMRFNATSSNPLISTIIDNLKKIEFALINYIIIFNEVFLELYLYNNGVKKMEVLDYYRRAVINTFMLAFHDLQLKVFHGTPSSVSDIDQSVINKVIDDCKKYSNINKKDMESLMLIKNDNLIVYFNTINNAVREIIDEKHITPTSDDSMEIIQNNYTEPRNQLTPMHLLRSRLQRKYNNPEIKELMNVFTLFDKDFLAKYTVAMKTIHDRVVIEDVPVNKGGKKRESRKRRNNSRGTRRQRR